jgi:hypothetical protein
VINTLALKLPERQQLFAKLLSPISDLRGRTGSPHWLVIDEAHQLLAATNKSASRSLLENVLATIYITVNPEFLAPEALRGVDVVLAFGDAAREVIGEFARALNIPRQDVARAPARDEALFWSRSSDQALRMIKVDAPWQVHRRHTGKYAVGDVGEWQSFYLRGPGN